MRAIVVERPGAAALQRVPRPEPGPGEILVRVRTAGICGSDVEVLEGRRPARYVRYPIIPDHEWAGLVAAIGPGVENVAEGDAVVAEGFRACGDCTRCREGLKFGLRNALDVYPSGTHIEPTAIALSRERERVRRGRLGLELLERSGYEFVRSELGAAGLAVPVPASGAVRG
jgi:threonine dehydrogenase-like Zn-dependent dehydrogenase